MTPDEVSEALAHKQNIFDALATVLVEKFPDHFLEPLQNQGAIEALAELLAATVVTRVMRFREAHRASGSEPKNQHEEEIIDTPMQVYVRMINLGMETAMQAVASRGLGNSTQN